MAKITQLSDDVIFIILENKSINSKDIANFKSTCKRFQQITLPDSFWRRKYYQNFSCPTAEKKYSKKKQKKNFHHINFKKILYYIDKLLNYAFIMSKLDKNLRNIYKKQLEHFLCSIVKNSKTYYIVWETINNISAEKSCELFSNLTCEYYFNLIFYLLRKLRFCHEQMKFMMMPTTKMILERQLTIMAKCFQPHISYSVIDTWLNNVTQTVLSCLKNKCPDRSIFSTDLEQFSFWRNNNIDESFWNKHESFSIICVLDEYIYSEIEFHEILMTLDFETECIEYILEHFREPLLAITFNIVARRLGVYSSLIPIENTIRIKWRPSYRNRNNQSCFFLNSNPLFCSDVLSFINCPIKCYLENLPCLKNTKSIIIYFHYKLEYDDKLQFNWNIKFFIFLREFFNDNYKNIQIEYEKFTSTTEDKSKTVEKSINVRRKNVRYAVGMIVTHLHNADDCDGVIIGWHCKCDKQYLKKLYKNNMFVMDCIATSEVCVEARSNFTYCTCYMVHYILLTENKTVCYVQQDAISLCQPKKIDNIKIGKYFSTFDGTHYVPNENLRKYYPKDTAEAIANILKNELI